MGRKEDSTLFTMEFRNMPNSQKLAEMQARKRRELLTGYPDLITRLTRVRRYFTSGLIMA
jgi:hypothetical protein